MEIRTSKTKERVSQKQLARAASLKRLKTYASGKAID
jgi:hypothetical protein